MTGLKNFTSGGYYTHRNINHRNKHLGNEGDKEETGRWQGKRWYGDKNEIPCICSVLLRGHKIKQRNVPYPADGDH